MNITIQSENKVEFRYVPIGNAFKYGSFYYMRIEDTGDGITYKNAVGLLDGNVLYFDDTKLVAPVECDVVIK